MLLTPTSSRPVAPSPRRPLADAPSRPAFTLIEILVVVAIIIILVAIAIGVGTQVKTGASRRSTLTTLKSLEGIMKDYLAAGNPEPAAPTSWPYASAAPPAYAQTTPASDPINWVKALRASPEYAKKLASLPQGSDIVTPTPNPTILDSFGTPIRYVPYDTTTRKEGYFVSAGPDRVFLTQTSPALTTTPPADDIFSTDAQ